MKKIIRMSVASLTLLICGTADAQFYTVNFINPGIDTLSKSKDPLLHQADSFDASQDVQAFAKVAQNKTVEKYGNGKRTEIEEKNIIRDDAAMPEFSEIPSLEVSDSLFLELIRKRLNVCMPLDYVYLTSSYGYRRDPFQKCTRFHDGIDLRGKHQLAYCMLPGKVVRVRHDGTGYGNHVVIEHGRLRTLYGHLGEIAVREGDFVSAGTVIGLTGRTGKATGYHLHLALHKLDGKDRWVSVDPQPFIESLNEYIGNLARKLSMLKGKKTVADIETDEPPTIESLYEALKRHGVKFPKIVLAQAILESGWNLDSRLARENNNLFGLRKSKTRYHAFGSWEESVMAYVTMVQYKYKGGDYYKFLKSVGYSESGSYINKVKSIADRL